MSVDMDSRLPTVLAYEQSWTLFADGEDLASVNFEEICQMTAGNKI